MNSWYFPLLCLTRNAWTSFHSYPWGTAAAFLLPQRLCDMVNEFFAKTKTKACQQSHNRVQPLRSKINVCVCVCVLLVFVATKADSCHWSMCNAQRLFCASVHCWGEFVHKCIWSSYAFSSFENSINSK